MSVKDRLKEYIKSKSDSIKDFEESIGVSNGYVNSISKAIGPDKLKLILEKYPKINIEWLLMGIGNREKKGAENSSNIIELNPDGKFNTLVADVKASAGMGYLLESKEGLESLPGMSIPNAPMGLNIAFQIEGDSMHPTIRHSDFVVGNKIEDINLFRDGYVYVLIDKDDGVLCKRVYDSGDKWEITSDNDSYRTYFRDKSDVSSIFKAFSRFSTDFRPYLDDIRKDMADIKRRLSKVERSIR